MSEVHVQGAALVASLVAMVLVSWASSVESAAATAGGGALLGVALASLTGLRFIDLEEEQ